MDEITIEKVKQILTQWNPLGERASLIEDLNEYETEAIDILFHLNFSNSHSEATNLVQTVLNQAFDLELTREDCQGEADKIWKVFLESDEQQ
jgi:hypothetical protein